MTRIVVARPVPEEALALLRPRADVAVGPEEPPLPSADEMRAMVRDADVLYTLPGARVDADVIAAAPKLRMIATLATGYDSIDVSSARARGIPVTYAPGILDETTADGAFGLLIAAARRFGESERYLRGGAFRGWTPFMFLGQDVHHGTLGIVGMGRIGQQVARRARGFEMRVLYHDERRNDRAERELGVEYAALDRLLAEADFVSLHVPLMPSTRHLIDAAALRKMKRTAVLVNTARGPVVDERALAEALRDGVIAAAGIDVYEREPEVDPLLLQQENAVLLPHVASASGPTRTRMAVRAAENILAFLDGKPLLDPVP
ncbi:MAG: D-glycerate dehydrogenase [Chloroflexi bacterium]|nr:D-glycerate dehydrogenase [Chloroflexota bacterium]